MPEPKQEIDVIDRQGIGLGPVEVLAQTPPDLAGDDLVDRARGCRAGGDPIVLRRNRHVVSNFSQVVETLAPYGYWTVNEVAKLDRKPLKEK